MKYRVSEFFYFLVTKKNDRMQMRGGMVTSRGEIKLHLVSAPCSASQFDSFLIRNYQIFSETKRERRLLCDTLLIIDRYHCTGV